MDPTGIFFLYVIASPQAECQARVNVNATHGTKTRVAHVSLHLMGSSRSTVADAETRRAYKR